MTIKKSKKHYTFHFILHTIITDKILTFKDAEVRDRNQKIFLKSVTLFKLFYILLLDGITVNTFFQIDIELQELVMITYSKILLDG